MKFFGPPIIRWRLCKVFEKLNRSHHLIANIFKLCKYETFGLLEMHNMNKTWFANSKFSFEKVWIMINRLLKILFYNVCLFHIFKFQITIVKNLMEEPSFFYNGFWGFLSSCTRSQIPLTYIILTIKGSYFQGFLKFPPKCILFLYFF